jgi:hypothetical protein
VGGSVITGSNIKVSLGGQNDVLQRENLEVQKEILAEKKRAAEKKLQEEEDRKRAEQEQLERSRAEEIARHLREKEQKVIDDALCKIQEQTANTYIAIMNERNLKKYKEWATKTIAADYSSTVKGKDGKVTNLVGVDNAIETAKTRFDEKVTWTGFKILSNTPAGIVYMIKMTWPKTGYSWSTQCMWKFNENGQIATAKWDPNGFGFG